VLRFEILLTYTLRMGANQEIEIKFCVENVRALSRRLRAAGFRLLTARTHEMNSLYDLPGQKLRRKGQLLRLREYGAEWVLTHKSKGKTSRHKMRIELETKVSDGVRMDAILRALGYAPTFRYEKFRAEWADAKGHVVIDETPIGNFGEIEGPPRWIDETARQLDVKPSQYVTKTYSELFFEWKKRSASPAQEMTFQAIRGRR